MLINYWDCKFSAYDEIWDDEEDVSIYRCTHPNGTVCNLDNKFAGDKKNCKLIDEPKNECSKGGNHEWGIDGMHSNTYCKKCFIDKPEVGQMKCDGSNTKTIRICCDSRQFVCDYAVRVKSDEQQNLKFVVCRKHCKGEKT